MHTYTYILNDEHPINIVYAQNYENRFCAHKPPWESTTNTVESNNLKFIGHRCSNL